MKAFRLNVDQAELFFTICQELKAETEEERTLILEAMARGGEVEGITETSQSKEQYLEHLRKNFGNVLNITNGVSPRLHGETSKGDSPNGKPTNSIGFDVSDSGNSSNASSNI